MAVLAFNNAQTRVAQVDGGQNDTDQLAAAADAIVEVVQDWNARKNWKWLLQDNSDDPIDLVGNQAVYDLPALTKAPYTARFISQNKTLIYTEQRHVDRIIRDQASSGFTSHYTLFNTDQVGGTYVANTPQDQAGYIKLIRAPTGAATDELLVRYYRLLATPTGTNNLDVLDRYQSAMLAGARFKYLASKSSNPQKIQMWQQISENLFRWMVADDSGVKEDDQPRLLPQTEYGFAYGSNDLLTDLWST